MLVLRLGLFFNHLTPLMSGQHSNVDLYGTVVGEVFVSDLCFV